jgi:hypothetical protein
VHTYAQRIIWIARVWYDQPAQTVYVFTSLLAHNLLSRLSSLCLLCHGAQDVLDGALAKGITSLLDRVSQCEARISSRSATRAGGGQYEDGSNGASLAPEVVPEVAPTAAAVSSAEEEVGEEDDDESEDDDLY